MKYQAEPWTCGPASVVNALRSIGIKITERQAVNYTSTTEKEGTDAPGIVNAINQWAHGTSFDLVGFEAAVRKIRQGWPSIICVHGFNHWVVIVGVTASGHYIIADSVVTQANQNENGIHILTRNQLRKLWRHGKTYSGVIVKPG